MVYTPGDSALTANIAVVPSIDDTDFIDIAVDDLFEHLRGKIEQFHVADGL
jgi:hypothetical protein